MSKLKFILTPLLLIPAIGFAQNASFNSINDEVGYASLFAGNFSALLSIVIGIIATFLVLKAAKRMGGGLFGSVLNYVGVGMTLVVLGTISVVFGNLTPNVWFDLINTVCFSVGYIFMVIGANKLLKGIINT